MEKIRNLHLLFLVLSILHSYKRHFLHFRSAHDKIILEELFIVSTTHNPNLLFFFILFYLFFYCIIFVFELFTKVRKICKFIVCNFKRVLEVEEAHLLRNIRERNRSRPNGVLAPVTIAPNGLCKKQNSSADSGERSAAIGRPTRCTARARNISIPGPNTQEGDQNFEQRSTVLKMRTTVLFSLALLVLCVRAQLTNTSIILADENCVRGALRMQARRETSARNRSPHNQKHNSRNARPKSLE